MKRLIIICGFLLLLPFVAHAQLQPIPVQSSSAAEGSHVFHGTLFQGIIVNWQATTTARYFMLFDGTALPADGATTTCDSTTATTGCLALCIYLSESITTPNRFALDYTLHPVNMRRGVVAALSTGTGCGTLTVDGANDYFYGQVR